MSKIEISQRAVTEILNLLESHRELVAESVERENRKSHNPDRASFWEGYLSGVDDAGLHVEGLVKTTGKFTITN